MIRKKKKMKKSCFIIFQKIENENLKLTHIIKEAFVKNQQQSNTPQSGGRGIERTVEKYIGDIGEGTGGGLSKIRLTWL